MFDLIGNVACQAMPPSLPFKLIYQLLMEQNLHITHPETETLSRPPAELHISFYLTPDREERQIVDLPYSPPRQPTGNFLFGSPPGVGSSARVTRARTAQGDATHGTAHSSRKGKENILDSDADSNVPPIDVPSDEPLVCIPASQVHRILSLLVNRECQAKIADKIIRLIGLLLFLCKKEGIILMPLLRNAKLHLDLRLLPRLLPVLLRLVVLLALLTDLILH